MAAHSTYPLLPDPAVLTLDSLAIQNGVIVFAARAVTAGATCPSCDHPSQRVHSRYARTLLDLPWQGNAVRIALSVRKFFCDNRECERRIFAERFPAVAARYARKTARLAEALRELAYLAGGEAAARIARAFGLVVSPDALLEGLKKAPPVSLGTPRVLGIDDFAFRKGRTYGTLLVDLERRCPVDLLPDREAASVEGWLKARPGVEIVSRDRAEAYRNGVTAGAPNVVQVADRFHLLANLRQAVQESLTPHKKHFRRAATASPSARGSPVGSVAAAVTGSKTKLQKLQAERRQARLEKWQRTQALREQGFTNAQIALEVGLSKRTVIRFLKGDVYPERKARTRSTNSLTPYLPFIEQQWEAGRRCAALLHRQVQAQGFTGSYASVRGALCRLGKGMALYADEACSVVVPVRPSHYSVRQMTWLFLRSADEAALSQEEKEDLSATLAAVPALSPLKELAHEFLRLVRQRHAAALLPWLEAATASAFGAMKRLSASLQSDGAAVRAALEQGWSNGQVEGQVNRLKFVKRSMYGRAGFDLLRARVLYQSA
jgi:transposase